MSLVIFALAVTVSLPIAVSPRRPRGIHRLGHLAKGLELAGIGAYRLEGLDGCIDLRAGGKAGTRCKGNDDTSGKNMLHLHLHLIWAAPRCQNKAPNP